MTILKKAPLMAFVVGLGLMTIGTMSSFEQKSATRYYYYNNQWNDSPPTIGECQPVDPEKICSGEFEVQPTGDNDYSDHAGDVTAETLGLIL